MKIASNNQPNLPRSLGKAPAPAEKNPYQMDQFELQQEVWDSQREVANVRAKIQTGQTTAVAGMGVLFTSLGNLSWSFDMSKPMASLPVTIYQYAGSPYDEWVALAWAGAFLITAGVLFLNILSRVVLAPRGKAS